MFGRLVEFVSARVCCDHSVHARLGFVSAGVRQGTVSVHASPDACVVCNGVILQRLAVVSLSLVVRREKKEGGENGNE